MELADLYRRSVETWLIRVDAIPADSWDAPTPCSEWTVRDLVNHVAGEDAWTTPLMRGTTMAEVGDALDGDLLGEDPIASATRHAEEARAVVAERLPNGGTVHLSYGEEDMAEFVRQLSADHLLHAWDLAAATEGHRRLDGSLVSEVAAWFADREDLYRQAGAIGPRVSTGGNDPQDELLAGSGRDPAWTPQQH